jgi:hypothetical protein
MLRIHLTLIWINAVNVGLLRNQEIAHSGARFLTFVLAIAKIN